MSEAPLISFPVMGQTDPLNFDTIDELDNWLGNEMQFWSWLQPLTGQDGSLHPLWAEMNNAWARVRNQIQSYRANGDPSYRKNVVSNIASELTTLYRTPHCILSTSPASQYIENQKSTSPLVAAFILYGLINKSRLNQAPTADAIKGITLSVLYERGIGSDTAAAHQAALLVATDRWNSFHENALKTYKEQRSEFSTFANDLKAWRENQHTQHETMIAATSETFDKIAKDGNEKFEQIQKTYNEQLGLQAPVKYWEDRAQTNLKTSIWFSLASIVTAVAAGIAVWAEIQWLVIPFSDSGTSTDTNSTPFTAHAWRYAFVIASAAFFVWPIRILVRILLSAVHLRTDALERATMAKTYLSLLSRNEGLDQKDRRLILEVLFRPSTTGIVADDAAPASLIQYLSRLGSGDRR